MPAFIPGIALNQAFYQEAVRPILEEHFPGLPYTAALVSYGSDALGFDTPVSRDHMWGPRMDLFLAPDDFAERRDAIYERLRQQLPTHFRGYSTHFGAPDPQDGGVRIKAERAHGPVDPLILFHTLADFWQSSLGVAPDAALTPVDWLTFSEQSLALISKGTLYHDGLGFAAIRRRFTYYPHDVWLYLLAAQWRLIAQEEAFVGRTAQVGDSLGTCIVAARLVERLMHLCFLLEKQYAPYSKWLGTAFQGLACAARMSPLLEGALAARDDPEREAYLAQAYSLAAEMHNGLGLTPPLETRTRTYSAWHALRDGVPDLALDDPANTRPHRVIFGDRFVDALRDTIHDPHVVALFPHIGSVNQFLTPSSDALQQTQFCRSLKAAFDQKEAA